MIKPIVNISKIIDAYDTLIVGYNGVLTEGNGIKTEAASALVSLKKAGKKLILLTNSPLRVVKIARILQENKVPPAVFDSIISAGEILHYRLKNRTGEFAAIGNSYYTLGAPDECGVFAGLDYQAVNDLGKADFMYMGTVSSAEDLPDKYLPSLEYAASLGIPFVCAGNDTSSYMNGSVCLAPGAFAEQYAVLGGKIITVGKPDIKILEYCLDDIENIDKSKVLLVGDSIATDIKGANLLDVPAALVSKGVHVNYLGEGYIPDVAKTRELATTFDAYPDYIISNLRW